jgi:hypothetical protein
VLVSHTYNPIYSGNRDWEDHSLRSPYEKSWHDPSWPTAGTEVHTYHPSYVGGWDQEDCSVWLVWAINSRDTVLMGKKLGMVVHTCHPSDGKKSNIVWPRQKVRPCLKTNQSRKGRGEAQVVECLPSKFKAHQIKNYKYVL